MRWRLDRWWKLFLFISVQERCWPGPVTRRYPSAGASLGVTGRQAFVWFPLMNLRGSCDRGACSIFTVQKSTGRCVPGPPSWAAQKTSRPGQPRRIAGHLSARGKTPCPHAVPWSGRRSALLSTPPTAPPFPLRPGPSPVEATLPFDRGCQLVSPHTCCGKLCW